MSQCPQNGAHVPSHSPKSFVHPSAQQTGDRLSAPQIQISNFNFPHLTTNYSVLTTKYFPIFLLKILSQLFRLGCASFPCEFGSNIFGTLTHVCVLKVHYGWTSCIGQFENGVVSRHKDNRPLRNNIYFCRSRSLTLQ